MALRKDMTNAEILKVCKTKPQYEETYQKGQVANDHNDLIDRINRPHSFVEVIKHADLGDDIEVITVKVYYNKNLL